MKCLRYCRSMSFTLFFATSSTPRNAMSRKSCIAQYLLSLSEFNSSSFEFDITADLVAGVSTQTTRHPLLSNSINHETAPILATSFHTAPSCQSYTFKNNRSFLIFKLHYFTSNKNFNREKYLLILEIVTYVTCRIYYRVSLHKTYGTRAHFCERSTKIFHQCHKRCRTVGVKKNDVVAR